MNKRGCSVLFLGKKDDSHTKKALDFCLANFSRVEAELGRFGDPEPEIFKSWKGDYIISYLCPWIVPADLLKRIRLAAINFHPASPEYPGIGCNNFALYEGAAEYGATCHHLASRVDTGGIIAVKRFRVFPTDDVASLLGRTHDYQLALFYDIASLLVDDKKLPESRERWTRKPFTRKELNELASLTADMDEAEIAKRVRATTFGPWKPEFKSR